jgi:hypothetical protein
MALVEFDAGDGSRIVVQVDDGNPEDPGGLSRAGAGDRVLRAAEQTWEQALTGMQAAAEGALNQLRRIDPPPDEVKVNFGIAVNGKVGALLVDTGADAHLKVEVTWKSKPNVIPGVEP